MKKIFSVYILILSLSSCSVFNSKTISSKPVSDQKEIYQELKMILKEGVKMGIDGSRNNQNFCLGRSIELQKKAVTLKKSSEEKSFVNLAISANHLELCTSCDAPIAKDHCEWAADTLNEMRVMYGWN